MDQAKALAFGLRDVKLTALSVDRTSRVGGAIDLPASRTLSFSISTSSTELRGDDRLIASRDNGPTVDWDLESGGISFEAWAIMGGGVVTVTGITPNIVKRFRQLVTDNRPYFVAEGQAINDNGGDLHGIIYCAKADGSLEAAMGDGEFMLTAASGKGFSSLEPAFLDVVYDFIQNETATAITGANNEVQAMIIDATSGTFTMTYAGQPTTAIPVAALSAGVIQAALEALSNLAPGDVSVAGGTGFYTITFGGTLANTNVAQIVLDVALLAGGSAAIYTQHAGG